MAVTVVVIMVLSSVSAVLNKESGVGTAGCRTTCDAADKGVGDRGEGLAALGPPHLHSTRGGRVRS
jgi:hypothetical protein